MRRLKSQYEGASGRFERPAPIPRKLKVNEDDDEPTYVDEESSEIISKEKYEDLMRGTAGNDGKDKAQSKGDQEQFESKTKPEEGKGEIGKETEGSASKQKNMTEVGSGPRKRKQAKVVGEENAPDNAQAQVQAQPKTTKKAKQTKKKIKLSFDET